MLPPSNQLGCLGKCELLPTGRRINVVLFIEQALRLSNVTEICQIKKNNSIHICILLDEQVFGALNHQNSYLFQNNGENVACKSNLDLSRLVRTNIDHSYVCFRNAFCTTSSGKICPQGQISEIN